MNSEPLDDLPRYALDPHGGMYGPVDAGPDTFVRHEDLAECGGVVRAPRWRPIATVPWERAVLVAHGRSVLVAVHRRAGNGCPARWNGPSADDFTYDGPSHWMPLPAPPGAVAPDRVAKEPPADDAVDPGVATER